MNFPRLQMLAEAKKKKAKDEMEFTLDTDMESGEGEGEMESAGEKEDAPKGKKDKAQMSKADVIACLKDMSPKDRAAVHKKLMAMVEKDEEAE